MANTFTQIYIHFVFAVQNRASLIQPEWKDELYKYITGIVQKNGHKLIAINGTANHIHIFVGYKPHQLIPELMQDVKGSSSKWINEKKFVKGKFNRQEGYGAFSYSHSQIAYVYDYILNQEKHHSKQTFQDEYMDFLKKFEIEHEVKYLFEWIK